MAVMLASAFGQYLPGPDKGRADLKVRLYTPLRH